MSLGWLSEPGVLPQPKPSRLDLGSTSVAQSALESVIVAKEEEVRRKGTLVDSNPTKLLKERQEFDFTIIAKSPNSLLILYLYASVFFFKNKNTNQKHKLEII